MSTRRVIAGYVLGLLLAVLVFTPHRYGVSRIVAAGSLWRSASVPPDEIDLGALQQHALLSRFADSVNLSAPLPEYPRPQLQRRRWMSLNGWWQWQEIRGRLALGSTLTHRCLVPFPAEV